ncbi:MAG: YihA family ribosome biogenesis GTP-binding protein [Acidobacteria bacterium]|nr:YihA family ribosome biogenesis GTP-binding protein [Acidobacteriota bacterium]
MNTPRTVELAHVAAQPDQFPRDGRPEIALLGRSNVGKSSLLNALLGRPSLARVSKDPGRTRQIHFYLLDERYYLVDLPGYGYAKISRDVREGWKQLVRGYLERAPDPLVLALQLIDVRHEPMKVDHEIGELLAEREVPTGIVLTKADKVSGSKVSRSAAAVRRAFGLPPDTLIAATSSVTGSGVRQLRTLLGHVFEAE